MVRILYPCALILALAACGSDAPQAQTQADKPVARPASLNLHPGVPAKQLFGAARAGSDQRAAPYGSYAKGCAAGSVQLAETGPTWQAMRLSRNRNWGHPEMIDYLHKLSRRVTRDAGWNGLYIGDISQPRGGPMLTGHASHQIGLDADIWMLPPSRLNLTAAERENISSISMRRSRGAFTNDSWTKGHEAVLKAAASDPRVARIFVFPGAKVAMCKSATGDRSWLRKIRPWYGHHYHFHVRLKCPEGTEGCVNQAPPPAGDGCDAAQTWVDNILNPPPPDPNAKPRAPRPPITMATLPGQCGSVLSSQ